ncbi:UDP-3-O-acyl-N-acetylglucosamine deacetylase [Candidatus Pelagibacter communis]|uniref:UDP-3-O-acyl-N-acetylglucosamine deacetylase n=1 Tax=Pelagibacter ubique TaxID=198252 RepID=UPI00094CC5C4|nr:UDP-3-O-acyl-N-acetylglucosamine deacetylase [Candidatus Pelagibacter ubique]
MSILNQKTLNQPINFEGITLHKGKHAKVRILPSSPNSGVVFKRVDLKNNNFISANFENVSNANLCTTITNEFGVSVSTIEHLMAAMYGKGVDNAIIEIDQDEVPIKDGSAKYFIEEIEKVGLNVSSTPIKIIKILNKVEFKDGEKTISIEPSKTSLEIDFEIKFKNQKIGTQRNCVNMYESDLENIYNSRTFCLYEDVEKLKKMNLAQGGSLDNAIVVKGNKIINEGGLRNEKEFVNHKILDCMGDLFLSGAKIIGKIVCSQGGHKLTNQMLRKVFNNNQNFSIFELKEKNIPHSFINKTALKSIA